MADRIAQVAEVLGQAGATHHAVYRRDDGADDDWATWYADWLVNRSTLPEILGRAPVRAELCWLLVQADRDHKAQAPGTPWEPFYAERIVASFGS